MRLAKENLPNATPLTLEKRISINEFFWCHFKGTPFDVKEKRVGSEGLKAATKVSKSPTTFPIPMFSPRRSSKISKPPSNNSAKSPRIWAQNT